MFQIFIFNSAGGRLRERGRHFVLVSPEFVNVLLRDKSPFSVGHSCHFFKEYILLSEVITEVTYHILS